MSMLSSRQSRLSITDAVTEFIETERQIMREEQRKRRERPPPHISLWRVHHARWKTHAIGFIASLAVSSFFLVLLFLFLGSSWNPPKHYKNVRVAVLNLEGTAAPAFVGPALVSLTRSKLYNSNFTYHYLDASTVTEAQVLADVQEFKFHAALIVPSDASLSLLTAPNTSTTPIPIEVVLDEGALGQVMSSLIRLMMLRLVMVYHKTEVSAVLLAQAQQGQLSIAPERLLTPVVYTEVNLHKPEFSGLSSAVGLLVIMFWTASLIGANLVIKIVQPLAKQNVRGDQILLMQMFYVVIVSFILSFWPPVVMKGLGAKFSAYTFGHLWMFLWLSIMVYMGTAMTLIMLLGDAAGNLVQLLTMMINYITSGLQPLDLAPAFYHLGYGLPMFQTSQGSKRIVFGSFSNHIMGRNVGILFGWLGLLFFHGLYRVYQRRQKICEYEEKCRLSLYEQEEGKPLASLDLHMADDIPKPVPDPRNYHIAEPKEKPLGPSIHPSTGHTSMHPSLHPMAHPSLHPTVKVEDMNGAGQEATH